MDLFQAIVLGLLQGITEWLPISSQGQIVAAAVTFMGISLKEAGKYAILLHIGTLIAAVFYFRKELARFVSERNKKALRFVLIVLVGSAITGVPLYILFKNVSISSHILIVIGVFLLASGLVQHKARKWKPKIGEKNGLLLGLAQGLSVLPGISRSGITASVLLLQDFEPEKAFRISFLISIPSILFGEMMFAAYEGATILIDFNVVVAIAIAAITGYITIHILISIAKRIRFAPFCFLFGAFYILIALMQLI